MFSIFIKFSARDVKHYLKFILISNLVQMPPCSCSFQQDAATHQTGFLSGEKALPATGNSEFPQGWKKPPGGRLLSAIPAKLKA